MDKSNGFYNMSEKRDAKDTGGRWKKQSGGEGQRYNFPIKIIRAILKTKESSRIIFQ